MKKTLLSLGTIVSAVAPVVSVIACGDGDVPGHEAPYEITISADSAKPTQANVEIKLKGYVSESYLKEIKSRIAESIAAANKDELKYSTAYIRIGSISAPLSIRQVEKLISTTPLTNANKNDLDAIHTFLDSSFDSLINEVKAYKVTKKYFEKDIWENIHHQIDKLDKNEVKLRLLKLFGFENITNPDMIDFEYNLISDKYIDITITRTNIAASPELIQHFFGNPSTTFEPFLEGEKMNLGIIFNSKNKYNDKTFDINDDEYMTIYKPGSSNSKYGPMGTGGPPGKRNSKAQIYKIAKYLLKANGYNDDIIYAHYTTLASPDIGDDLKTLGNSASKVFGYGDNGQTAGINYDNLGARRVYNRDFQVQFNFDKKTFKLFYSSDSYDQKQWIFGTDGHLVTEPTKEWKLELEGTYEVDDTDIKANSITLTKATATDGTKTIHLLKSSAKLIAMSALKDKHWFNNGW